MDREDEIKIEVALRLLDMAARLGNNYLRRRMELMNKKKITIEDVEALEIEDQNPGDVFDNI